MKEWRSGPNWIRPRTSAASGRPTTKAARVVLVRRGGAGGGGGGGGVRGAPPTKAARVVLVRRAWPAAAGAEGFIRALLQRKSGLSLPHRPRAGGDCSDSAAPRQTGLPPRVPLRCTRGFIRATPPGFARQRRLS